MSGLSALVSGSQINIRNPKNIKGNPTAMAHDLDTKAIFGLDPKMIGGSNQYHFS
jgi:hypothetical protein